jgi:hypothetical protein
MGLSQGLDGGACGRVGRKHAVQVNFRRSYFGQERPAGDHILSGGCISSPVWGDLGLLTVLFAFIRRWSSICTALARWQFWVIPGIHENPLKDKETT